MGNKFTGFQELKDLAQKEADRVAAERLAQHEIAMQDNIVFAAEASELGWKVGKYAPDFVVYGLDFDFLFAKKDPEGETQMWVYYNRKEQKYSVIFND